MMQGRKFLTASNAFENGTLVTSVSPEPSGYAIPVLA